MRKALFSLAVVALVACAEPPRPPPATAPTGSTASSDVARAEPAIGAPQFAEPEGIGAKRHVPPEAPPAGKAVWVVDPGSSFVSATLGFNDPLTITFAGAVTGALDSEAGKGVFALDLTTLESTDGAHRKDRVRDAAIIEGFFAARPSPKQEVTTAWRGLADKLAPGVTRATLVVDKVSIGAKMILSPPAKVNPEYVEASSAEARLFLWDSVETKLDVPLKMSRRDGSLDVTSDGPFKLHIGRLAGTAIRTKLVDAMRAAGFSKPGGIGDEVSVVIRLKMTLGAP